MGPAEHRDEAGLWITLSCACRLLQRPELTGSHRQHPRAGDTCSCPGSAGKDLFLGHVGTKAGQCWSWGSGRGQGQRLSSPWCAAPGQQHSSSLQRSPSGPAWTQEREHAVQEIPPETAWCGLGHPDPAWEGAHGLTWTEPLGSRRWRSQSWCNGHQQGLTWCCWLLVSG